MTDWLELQGVAARRFTDLVHAIQDADWVRPTPCSDWDVRALVGHLVEEQWWVPGFLAGMPFAEVEADVARRSLGEDVRADWDEAAMQARAAWTAPGALEGNVQLGRGPTPAAQYLVEMTFDLAVHGWDLATAIGQRSPLDEELAAPVLEALEPMADELPATGLFAAPVQLNDDATPPERLLALTGRDPRG